MDISISTKVQDKVAALIQSGINPTEIWLGPEEAESFEDEMQYYFKDVAAVNGRRVLVTDGIWKYLGLTIRFMAGDGIRVGISI